MKYITILTLVLFTIACGNKKEEIVEQIKAYKDSFNLARNTENFYSLLGSELRQYGKPVYSDKRFLKNVPQYVIDNNRCDSAKSSWLIKKTNFEAKIDSLELELKKY